MPCDDISAVITLVLDGDERLRYYLYEKLTCGKIIPLSQRLQAHCKGMDLDAIAALDRRPLARAFAIESEDDLFVLDKELDALQSAVANYRGADASLDPRRYAIESVEWGPEGVTIRQLIREPEPDARIQSCRTLASGASG